jgi:flagellar hook-basal body complex protein FliE
VNPVSPTPLFSLPPAAASSSARLSGAGGGDFSQLFTQMLDATGQQQAQANRAVTDLAAGATDQLHNVLLEVAKADLAFRLVLEMRNRLTEAYQEVMKMQV